MDYKNRQLIRCYVDGLMCELMSVWVCVLLRVQNIWDTMWQWIIVIEMRNCIAKVFITFQMRRVKTTARNQFDHRRFRTDKFKRSIFEHAP